jgi:hypothetical protein
MQDDNVACVYLLNLYGKDLRYFQQRNITEQQLIDNVLNEPRHVDNTTNNARFFQVAPHHVVDDRVSQEGILLIRAFDNNSKPVEIDKLPQFGIQIGDITQTLSPSSGGVTRILCLEKPLEKARLREPVVVDVRSGETTIGKRYSWYRPLDGWGINYSLLGVAFSWPSWKFKGTPETSVVPAMVECEYRHFKANGSMYVFSSIGIGPNLVLSQSDNKTGDNKSTGSGINGLVGAATLNLNGFKFGLGARWSWSEGRADPMLILSITEVVARNLGIAGSVPDSLVQQEK